MIDYKTDKENTTQRKFTIINETNAKILQLEEILSYLKSKLDEENNREVKSKMVIDELQTEFNARTDELRKFATTARTEVHKLDGLLEYLNEKIKEQRLEIEEYEKTLDSMRDENGDLNVGVDKLKEILKKGADIHDATVEVVEESQKVIDSSDEFLEEESRKNNE